MPRAEELGVSLEGIEVIHPALEDDARYRYADELYARRRRQGLTLTEARRTCTSPFLRGMMVRLGEADALVAGIDSNYPEVLRPALEVVAAREGVSEGLWCVTWWRSPNRDLLFFADTTVNIDPIAVPPWRKWPSSPPASSGGWDHPRIAMISFSNFGSVRHPATYKVRERWSG